jgi:hypothetical protein
MTHTFHLLVSGDFEDLHYQNETINSGNQVKSGRHSVEKNKIIVMSIFEYFPSTLLYFDLLFFFATSNTQHYSRIPYDEKILLK